MYSEIVSGRNGTALSNFSWKNRETQRRRVLALIEALVESERNFRHFRKALSQRFVPEALNATGFSLKAVPFVSGSNSND